MLTLPRHMPTDFDARERHSTVRVSRIDDLELEPIRRQIFEGALEVERLERAVRVLCRARPHLRGDALPVADIALIFVMSASMLLAFGWLLDDCAAAPSIAVTISRKSSDALMPFRM